MDIHTQKSGPTNTEDLTGVKYEILFLHLSRLKMKDVRQLFCKMRSDTANANALFPAYGFTAGEFTLAYIFNMPHRNKYNYSTITESSHATL